MIELIKQLQEHHLNVSVCESFTGGLLASAFTHVPGVSSVFKGGIVAYQNSVKEHLLQIDAQLLNTEGAISEACAKAMAIQTQKLLDSDICVALTGNAGPTCLEGKALGLWYLAISSHKGCITYQFQTQLERNQLQVYAVNLTIEYLKTWIKENT